MLAERWRACLALLGHPAQEVVLGLLQQLEGGGKVVVLLRRGVIVQQRQPVISAPEGAKTGSDVDIRRIALLMCQAKRMRWKKEKLHSDNQNQGPHFLTTSAESSSVSWNGKTLPCCS